MSVGFANRAHGFPRFSGLLHESCGNTCKQFCMALFMYLNAPSARERGGERERERERERAREGERGGETGEGGRGGRDEMDA